MYFEKVDNLEDIIYLTGVGNGTLGGTNLTAFALKSDGTIWSWGYNGAALGQCLSNNTTSNILDTPGQCFNHETADVVRNAKYIFVNSGLNTAGHSMVGYLDSDSFLYIGGFSTDSDAPDFSENIPFFRKFNMKNITPDVVLVGEQAIIHRENGTSYTVNKYGAKKAF
jgi:hypothetical protein